MSAENKARHSIKNTVLAERVYIDNCYVRGQRSIFKLEGGPAPWRGNVSRRLARVPREIRSMRNNAPENWLSTSSTLRSSNFGSSNFGSNGFDELVLIRVALRMKHSTIERTPVRYVVQPGFVFGLSVKGQATSRHIPAVMETLAWGWFRTNGGVSRIEPFAFGALANGYGTKTPCYLYGPRHHSPQQSRSRRRRSKGPFLA
jgi:hypothetical protein